jgi:5-carboxymethyl-2-hydroxymuconate isomerase
MPHLRVEYSPGLEEQADLEALCGVLHSAMADSGVFPLGGIRVKALRCDRALAGDREAINHFVAMELSVGAGRDKRVLQEAGQGVFEAARGALADLLSAPHFMLSIEIREIDPDLSWKANTVHARLQADHGG